MFMNLNVLLFSLNIGYWSVYFFLAGRMLTAYYTLGVLWYASISAVFRVGLTYRMHTKLYQLLYSKNDLISKLYKQRRSKGVDLCRSREQ